MAEEIVKISSTRFGELDISADSVLEIVGGIIGFPQSLRYILLDYNPPFSWLQAVDFPGLAFVVVNAAEFGDDYTFSLPIGDRDLDLKNDDDVAIMNLVSVRPDPSQTTVNLKAPVIVNLRNRRGRQIILDDARFPTRMQLWAQKEEK
jgi:flagellar assembly factor FliW